MGLLEAITHEYDGELDDAIRQYESTSELGSKLDQAGVWDCLARVHLKLGNLNQAAEWQVQAARAFTSLPKDAMPKDEAMYEALVRFRKAFANWVDDPQYRPSVMKEYGLAFDHCWDAFPEGITHEALFYAKALEVTDSPAEAAQVYEDAANILGDGVAPEDDEAQLVREVWQAAADAWEDAGDDDRADAALQRFEEHGGELPDEDGGDDA